MISAYAPLTACACALRCPLLFAPRRQDLDVQNRKGVVKGRESRIVIVSGVCLYLYLSFHHIISNDKTKRRLAASLRVSLWRACRPQGAVRRGVTPDIPIAARLPARPPKWLRPAPCGWLAACLPG